MLNMHTAYYRSIIPTYGQATLPFHLTTLGISAQSLLNGCLDHLGNTKPGLTTVLLPKYEYPNIFII